MKKIILILPFALLTSFIFGQDKLEVVGDGVITGNLNLGTGTNLVLGNGGTNLGNSCCHTIIGRDAGLALDGSYNSSTFIGVEAGRNTTHPDNVFVGTASGKANTFGVQNTFIGSVSGVNHVSGSNNVMVGTNAGPTDSSGNQLVLVGSFIDVASNNLNNAVAIGAASVVNSSNKVRIGNSSISVIEGQVAYSFPSDGRFKKNVKNDVSGLDFIMKLRPVTYNFDLATYNNHIRPADYQSKFSIEMLAAEKEAIEKSKKVIQAGFIAQEVEAAAKSIGFDFDGVVVPQNEKDNYSLRYSNFVVPLVQSTQEQQHYIDNLEYTVASQEKRITKLEQENREAMSEMAQLKAMVNNLLNSALISSDN